MKTPRVSVLLPVFNAAATLAETLQSIQAQSCEDFEVVAIDDGSEDGSGDILLEWNRCDSRFRALLSDHQGIVEAPNRGLALCRGAYVARMDADDRMHPERLEKQLAWLEGDPNLSVVSCLVEIFPRAETGEGMLVYEDWLNGLVDSAAIEREFFVESPIANPSAMMRRRELVALGGYQDRGWPEDYDLWLRYRAAGRRFAKVPEVLHYWREHPRRATHVQSRYSVENFLRAKAHYLCAGAAARSGRAGRLGRGQDRPSARQALGARGPRSRCICRYRDSRKSAAPCGASPWLGRMTYRRGGRATSGRFYWRPWRRGGRGR